MTLADLQRGLKAKAKIITQAELAHRLKVTPSYLSDVINGRREPGPALLDALNLEKVVTYRKKDLRRLS